MAVHVEAFPRHGCLPWVLRPVFAFVVWLSAPYLRLMDSSPTQELKEVHLAGKSIAFSRRDEILYCAKKPPLHMADQSDSLLSRQKVDQLRRVRAI